MRAICFLAVLSVFAVLPARSQADAIVLYNDFGPGQTYGPDALGAAGPNNPVFPGVQAAYALSFTPSTTVMFDAVLLPLSYTAGTNSAIVSLTADAGGHPGATPLESFTVSDMPSFPASSVYQLNSTTDPLLTAGNTYWITFFPGDSTSFVNWSDNSVGVIGLQNSADGGNTWNYSENPAPTMEVLGNALSTPEPTSLAMLAGLGICSMGCSGWTWRRRKSVAR